MASTELACAGAAVTEDALGGFLASRERACGCLVRHGGLYAGCSLAGVVLRGCDLDRPFLIVKQKYRTIWKKSRCHKSRHGNFCTRVLCLVRLEIDFVQLISRLWGPLCSLPSTQCGCTTRALVLDLTTRSPFAHCRLRAAITTSNELSIAVFASAFPRIRVSDTASANPRRLAMILDPEESPAVLLVFHVTGSVRR